MQTLINNHLFKGIDPKNLQSLFAALEEAHCAAGEYLFTESCSEASLYLVVEGTLTTERQDYPPVIIHEGDYLGEIAFLNNTFRNAKVKALEDCVLYKLYRQDFFNREILSAEVALILLQRLAGRISSYLNTRENTTTKALIQSGENEHVEYKSTLRCNLFSGKFDHDIEHACLKTIAAFLNSEGGTLLIGVSDDGSIIGIEKDLFQSTDKALLHLTNLIRTKISMLHQSFIDMHTENMDGKNIIRVDVKPAKMPAYLEYNQQEMMYIRIGPSTVNLKISEVYDYIQQRFK